MATGVAAERAGAILGALLLLHSVGCRVQVVDLRGGGGDAVQPVGDPGPPGPTGPCGDGERLDPTTSQCATCFQRPPPAGEMCPCAWSTHPPDFPYCDGGTSSYTCMLCPADGSVADCTARAADGTVRDCAQFIRCCGEIADGPTPCCQPGETLVCSYRPGSGQWDYVYACNGS